MQNKTLTKQIIITTVFVVSASLISFFIYSIVTPDATCSDKKQNQSEKGTDCGGPCTPCKVVQAADLAVQETSFVIGGNSTFDVIARIYNPNDSIGAKKFNYTFTLKDASGNVIASRSGSNFILPVDSKYVAELGLTVENGTSPAKAEIAINELEWVPLGDMEKPALGVYSKKFDKAPTGVGSEAEGLLRNESNYDLNKISIVIVLRSAEGRIVGVNMTEKNVVKVKEQRDFRLNWPYALPATVQKMEVDAQSNVLDPQNFTATR